MVSDKIFLPTIADQRTVPVYPHASHLYSCLKNSLHMSVSLVSKMNKEDYG